MGILADFFAATPEQATRYAHRFDEPDKGSAIKKLLAPKEYQGFTGLEMGTLWALLEGEPWDIDRHMLQEILLTHEGETWLERFPDALVQRLAHATPAQLAGVLVEWAKTEELACEPSELQPVLDDLQSLARDALNSGKFVYLWGSM